MSLKHGARVAVIGAGIAGLACARELAAGGASVTVYDASDSPGGRLTTLMSEAGGYDHGAQYFTVSDVRFASAVRGWEAEGVVQRWNGRVVAFSTSGVEDRTRAAERFVAVPDMLRLAVHLARDLQVRYDSTVARLRHEGSDWFVDCVGQEAQSADPYEAVCVALPSTGAAAMLRDLTPLADIAATVNWDPCWTAMIALPRSCGADFDAAFFTDDPILGWCARDSSKPRRGIVAGVAERWVLQARPRWSRRFFQMDEAEVAKWLVRSFSARIRRPLSPTHVTAVRWQYATPLNPLSQMFLWDDGQRIGAAGDWCTSPRVEGAYLSGVGLAQNMLR
ncbi:MAG: NAD(P)/FAD-dependent oxidoreductase [Gemmatimonadota bacterium]